MYISLWEIYRRASRTIAIILVLCNFCYEKLWFQTKRFTSALRTHDNSYEQYCIREIFHFHHLPKLYLCFNTAIKGSDNENRQCPLVSSVQWLPSFVYGQVIG